MPQTFVPGSQIKDGSITRADLNIGTSGSALILKISDSALGILVSSSTGADAGTGDVTLKLDLTYLNANYINSTVSRAQNSVLAGPSSGSGAPSFRALVAGDIPSLGGSYVINGTGQQATSNYNISGTGNIGGSLSIGTATNGNGASEMLRMANNSAYLSFYNAANTVRTGTVQGVTGTYILIGAENGAYIAFNTNNGDERLRITSSTGNLLVNTTTDAGYKLDVNGSASIGSKALHAGFSNEIWTQSGTNSTVDLNVNYRGYADGVTQFRNLMIWNGKGAMHTFFDATNDRLGLGTSAPLYKFHSKTTSSNIFYLEHGTNNGTDASGFYFGSNNNFQGAAILSYRTNASFSGNEADLRFYTFSGNNTSGFQGLEAGRITDTRNWLMGTTTDIGFKLQVTYTNNSATDYLSNGGLIITNTSTTNNTTANLQFVANSTGTTPAKASINLLCFNTTGGLGALLLGVSDSSGTVRQTANFGPSSLSLSAFSGDYVLSLNGSNVNASITLVNTTNGDLVFSRSGTGSVAFNSNVTVTNNSITASSIIPIASIAPQSDNTITLGTAAKRWTTVYATTGTINTSDKRQKTNFEPLMLGLKEVLYMADRTLSFDWKEKSIGGRQYGFFAQDLLKVMPLAVDASNPDLLGVNFANITPVIFNAIKEVNSKVVLVSNKVDEQAKEIAALKKEIQQLKSKYNAN